MSRQTKGRRRLPTLTRGQLRRDNRDLRHQLDGAGLLIEGLRNSIEEAEARLAERDEADKARHAQKKADGVDVGVLQKQLAAAEADNRELSAKYLAAMAMLQNATAIDVPPMHRDTTGADDQCTEAIYVQTLRDHMAKRGSPVRPLAEALGGAR